jgi:site-specific recombinase XerD
MQPAVSELVGACLGNIETDARGDHWVSVIGKGRNAGKVALPPLARTSLDRYLVEGRLPVTPSRRHPDTPLVGSLEQDSSAGISGVRLWAITRRFFAKAAEIIGADKPT